MPRLGKKQDPGTEIAILHAVRDSTKSKDSKKKHAVGNVTFHEDEVRRINKLLGDELGFLAEDFYDTSTY